MTAVLMSQSLSGFVYADEAVPSDEAIPEVIVVSEDTAEPAEGTAPADDATPAREPVSGDEPGPEEDTLSENEIMPAEDTVSGDAAVSEEASGANGEYKFNIKDWKYFNIDSCICLTEYIGSDPDVVLDRKYLDDGTEIALGGGAFSHNDRIRSVSITAYPKISGSYVLEGLFEGSKNLRRVDMSGVEANWTTSCARMFKDCTSLEKVDLLYHTWGCMYNFTNISSMFEGCSSLTEVDLSRILLQDVTECSGLFKGCTSLETVYMSEDEEVRIYPSKISSCTSILGTNISV